PPHRLDPRIPEKLSEIVAKLMQKNPADRYPTCEELVTALRLVLRPELEGSTPFAGLDSTVDGPPEGRGRSLFSRPWARAVLVGSVAAASVALLQETGAFDGLELRSLDARFAWTRGAPGESPLVLVVADRESKEKLAP